MSNRTRFTVAAATCLCVVASLAHANMVTNGSFENGPTLPPEQRMTLPVGSTVMTGWTVTRAPIDIVSDAYWQAAEGTRSLALNPTGNPGGLAQTIATLPGARYEVRFKLSGESSTIPALKHLRVSAAGASADFDYDSTDNWH